MTISNVVKMSLGAVFVALLATPASVVCAASCGASTCAATCGQVAATMPPPASSSCGCAAGTGGSGGAPSSSTGSSGAHPTSSPGTIGYGTAVGAMYDLMAGKTLNPRPVFDFSFSKGWHAVNGDLIPDNAIVDSNAVEDGSVTAQFISSMSDYRSSRASTYGVTASAWIFSASASTSSMRKSSFTAKHASFITTASKRFIIQRVSLPSANPQLLPLSQNFIADVKALNGSDMTACIGFVSQYGTHYVASATYGGSYMAYASVEESAMSSSSADSSSIKAGISAKFEASIGVSASSGTSSQSGSSATHIMSHYKVTALGGYPSQAGDNWNTWSKTVRSNPAKLDGESLGNIVDLVRSAAPEKVPVVEAAIAAYTSLCSKPNSTTADPVCGDHGQCQVNLLGSSPTGACVCDPGFEGTYCEIAECGRTPDGTLCGGQGTCDMASNTCTCNAGYGGRDCSCPLGANGAVCSGNGNCVSGSGCECFYGWGESVEGVSDCSRQCGTIALTLSSDTTSSVLRTTRGGKGLLAYDMDSAPDNVCTDQFPGVAGVTHVSFQTGLHEGVDTYRLEEQNVCHTILWKRCTRYTSITCNVPCELTP